MSLAIEIGALADLLHFDAEGAEWIREDMEIINDVLHARGLPTHKEPEKLDDVEDRSSMLSFPYSYLHTLRRIYALVRSNHSVIPLNGAEPSKEDEKLINELTSKLDSHLLCHSDEEGYYVPVDFPKPINDEDLPGEYLGSSQSLLRELQSIATAIDIVLIDGKLTPAQEKVLSTRDDDSHPYNRERIVWHTLFECAVTSLEHKSAIMFN